MSHVLRFISICDLFTDSLVPHTGMACRCLNRTSHKLLSTFVVSHNFTGVQSVTLMTGFLYCAQEFTYGADGPKWYARC
jgi:hypothetical protein